MLSLLQLTLFILLFLPAAWLFLAKIHKRKWPAGPFPWPLIGNAIQVLLTHPLHYVALQRMAAKYGNVFRVKLGVVDYAVVCGHAAVKQALVSDDIDDRFHDEWVLDRCYGSAQYGLLFSEGDAWRETRPYTLRALKEFGFGQPGMIDKILGQELQLFTAELQRKVTQSGAKFHLDCNDQIFAPMFVNLTVSTLTGVRFAQDDPQLLDLIRIARTFTATQNIGGNILGAFPFLKDWAPEKTGFAVAHRANASCSTTLKCCLIESYHRKNHFMENPSNFIEAFLQNMETGGSKAQLFTLKNLTCTLADLFAAGSETSSILLTFCLRHLVQKQDIQTKIRAEVDHVVGENEAIRMAHRSKLKYTEAFVLETLRLNTIAPIAPRYTVRDFRAGTGVVPKGTSVLVNLYSANMDPDVWEQPEVFRPERFLCSSSGELVQAEKLASFSFGKRDCLGQVVGKNSLIFAVATLVQCFVFAVDPVAGPPTNEVTNTLTVAPVPFKVIVMPR